MQQAHNSKHAGVHLFTCGLLCLLADVFFSGCTQDQENRYFLARKIQCDDFGMTLKTYAYQYDDQWRMTKETVTDGRDMMLQVTTWQYAEEDRSLKTERRTDGSGWAADSHVYYKEGRVIREDTDINDNGQKSRMTREYTYNPEGDLSSLTQLSYDDRGRVVERYSEVYEYEYTSWGKPSSKTVTMGESPSRASSSRTVYTYDVDFHLVSEKTANGEAQSAERTYYYDDQKRIAYALGDRPYQNEFYEYYDRFQGTPKAEEEARFPVQGTVNDNDILLYVSDRPGAPQAGTLTRGERVSVLAASDRVSAREGVRAPWLRIKTSQGVEGWAFGFFIDTDVYFPVLAYGGEILDPDPPAPIHSYLYLAGMQTPLYGDLARFTVEQTGAAGEQAQILRQDHRLYQNGRRYSRFYLVRYKGKQLWVSRNDITFHYFPLRSGFFTARENPVFRDMEGRPTLCAERSLFYTTANGVPHYLLPLTEFKGEESVRFVLSRITAEDVNGDQEIDIILKGETARGRVQAAGGEKITVERWARLRGNTLQVMFEKKEQGARGLTLFHYEYRYNRDERGFILDIFETRKYDNASLPDETTAYIWNGDIYEKYE